MHARTASEACLQNSADQPELAVRQASAILSAPSTDLPLRIDAQHCLALARQTLGQGQPAIQAATRLLTMLDTAGKEDRPELHQARLDAVTILARTGQPALIEGQLVDIVLKARAQQQTALEVDALTRIAQLIFSEFRDDRSAQAYLAQAEGMARAAGLSLRPILQAQLPIALDANHADTSEHLIKQLRTEPVADDTGQAMNWRLDTAQARIDLIMQDPVTARPLLLKTLAAQRRIGDLAGVRETLLALGLAESFLDRPKQAREYDLQALQLAETARTDTITALHQLLDVSYKSQQRADIERFGSRLMALGSHARRQQWKQSVRHIKSRLGPPLWAPATVGHRTQLAGWLHADRVSWLTRISLLLSCCSLGLIWYQSRRFRKRLQLSTIDPLSQLLTRREATSRIDQWIDSPSVPGSAGTSLVLLLVDIDHFKRINDQYGHAAGDSVLTEVANRLKSCCRRTDVIGRWGGEEFLIALPATDTPSTLALASRICEAISQKPIQTPSGASLQVTVSVGVSYWPFVPDNRAPGHWQDALVPADAALYAVKRSGRNGWASIRATPKALGGNIEQLLRDPVQASRQGLLSIHSVHALEWPVATDTPDER